MNELIQAMTALALYLGSYAAGHDVWVWVTEQLRNK